MVCELYLNRTIIDKKKERERKSKDMVTEMSYVVNKCIYIKNKEYLQGLVTMRSQMNSAKDSGELAQSKFDSSTNIYELHITHWHVPLR